MAITSMPQLDEKKKLCEQLIKELHAKYTDSKGYSETTSDGTERRPMFLLTEPSQIKDVSLQIAKIQDILDEIKAFTAKTPKIKAPVLLENVLMVRVWENAATTSMKDANSRIEIIDRLRKKLDRAVRDSNVQNIGQVKHLKESLEFFENETEEYYRKRTIGTSDIVSRVYFHGGGDKRYRITNSGLFVAGFGSEKPKVDLPSVEKALSRKGRPSIFDNLNPVKYSGGFGLNVYLYRESEVEAEKQRLSMTQDEVEKAVVSKD